MPYGRQPRLPASAATSSRSSCPDSTWQRRARSPNPSSSASPRAGSRTAAAVTASAGIASYPSQGTDASDLVRRADRALYRAKADGKNCVKLAPGGRRRPELTGQELRAGLRRTALALAARSRRALRRRGPRVAVPDVAARVARRLGLDAEDAELIRRRRAAERHRQARACPTTLLEKPGPLTRQSGERWSTIRRSAIGSSTRSASIRSPPGSSTTTSAGTGAAIPARLSGEQIPLGASILFVADAFEAMTSDQTWRRAMTAGGGARRARALRRDAVRPGDVVVSCGFEVSAVRGPIRLVELAGGGLKRDVPVLAGRPALALGQRGPQGADQNTGGCGAAR